jgi:hypothetical protein
MQKDILESLARLTDDELAERVKSLAAREHATAACVIAHLAEMDGRDIHLRAGYPSLYAYCLKVLHLSEWEAWNRINAGHVARRFPILFDMLEEGSIHLTGIKLLGSHLTEENHRRVLESARWKTKLEIGEIVARLRPLRDVPTSVMAIPEFAVVPQEAAPGPGVAPAPLSITPTTPPLSKPAVLTPLSPHRYKLQVTISGETLAKLRRAKDLLGHVVLAGDDDAVLNRALTVLVEKLEREKWARTDKPRPGRPRHPRARRPSAAVLRVLWERDEGRCKYTSPDGHRCAETRRIQPHHLDPWVLAGDSASADAFELRCQRHNDYEGRLYFGKRRRKGKGQADGEVRERSAPYGARSFGAELVPEQVAVDGGGQIKDPARAMHQVWCHGAEVGPP